MTYEEAWRSLEAAARDYASTGAMDQAKILADAASAYATARAKNTKAPHPAVSAGADVLLPFGRSKGKPLSEAPTNDLKWILGVIRESLDDPKKTRFRGENEKLCADIEAELESR